MFVPEACTSYNLWEKEKIAKWQCKKYPQWTSDMFAIFNRSGPNTKRDCAPYGRTYTYTAQYNYVICQDVSGLSPEVHQADLVLCNCMQCWQQHNEMMIGLPKPCLIRCHLLSLGDILQFHSCKTSHQEKKQQKNCMILKHKITFRLCITYFYNITRKQRNTKQRKFKTPSLCCP